MVSSINPDSIAAPIENIFSDEPGSYIALKLIKSILVLFLLTFTTHAFAKSNEYYQQTLIHVLTECNSACQKKVFEQEVHKAFFVLMDAILNQMRFELSQKEKELYD